jgi:hypothetical protein
MSRRQLAGWTVLLLGVTQVLVATAQSDRPREYRRAELPKFSQTEGEGIFFKDVYSEGVVGQRPANLKASASLPARTVPPPSGQPAAPPPAGPGAGWSKVIAAATIEDEVKAIKLKVDQSITTPTKFRGGDYRTCRLQFSILAMLFGIIEEYDGDVRWKESSPQLREAFARSAGNCKTGSDQAYNEAKLRKQDLQDAVGGGAVNLPASRPRENWENVCDRSPLMQRLETALQGRLQVWTANEATFRENGEAILHEAQMIAAMGRVLQQDGMMDAEDEDYNALAQEMCQAAGQVVGGVKSGSYPQVREAAGRIGQSCSECHESYRG